MKTDFQTKATSAVGSSALFDRPHCKKYLLRPIVEIVRNYGIRACESKALEIAHSLAVRTLVNVGGGRNSVRWAAAQNCDGLLDPALDFNTCSLAWRDGSVDLVVCEQVIEHLHNTTWFLSELHRILRPGGHLLLSTENLASLPNIFALLCQKAPFSTQAVCGRFIGGWRDGEAGYGIERAPNHPAFSGVRGHVRVMTVGQLRTLLEWSRFKILSKHGFGGNHYVLLHAQQPNTQAER
jgi:SAM-dependent methyltransferase